MHRLFVAIRPPAPIRAQLLALMQGVKGARWQDDDQLHVTLRFIGEVDGAQADDVAAALGTVAGQAFSTAISGVGAFDSRGRVNALWAGVRPVEPLARLHRKIDNALVRAGLEPERRAYLPHVTLARFGRESGGVDAFLAEHSSLSSPPFHVGAFALFESHLSQHGPSYLAVEQFPLRD
jgi:2'-5' RNA ligase